MFEDFFENNAPVGEEKPNPARTEQIKAAVMERISLDNAGNNAESKEKKMKHKFMRPFVIAAAVAAVGAGSFVSANAANNGIVADTITIISSNADRPEAWKEVDENGNVVYYTLPDDKSESPDLETETITSNDWSVVYYTVSDVDADILYDYIFTLEQNGTSK